MVTLAVVVVCVVAVCEPQIGRSLEPKRSVNICHQSPHQPKAAQNVLFAQCIQLILRYINLIGKKVVLAF